MNVYLDLTEDFSEEQPCALKEIGHGLVSLTMYLIQNSYDAYKGDIQEDIPVYYRGGTFRIINIKRVGNVIYLVIRGLFSSTDPYGEYLNGWSDQDVWPKEEIERPIEHSIVGDIPPDQYQYYINDEKAILGVEKFEDIIANYIPPTLD